MAAARCDCDFEQALACRDRSSAGGEASCRHSGNIMHREDGIRRKAGKQPVPDHRCGAEAVFLVGLKDEDHAANEITMSRQVCSRSE